MVTKTLFDFEETTDLTGIYFVTTKGASDDYKLQAEVLDQELEYKRFKGDVGKEWIFNDDPQYQDAPYIDIGLHRYRLSGTTGTRTNAPEFCEARKITEENFIFPDFKDGTIANNPLGSNEPNGLYKMDTIKNHDHDMQHDHDMSHQHNNISIFYEVSTFGMAKMQGNSFGWNKVSTTGGRDRTEATSRVKTGEAGDSDKTQMRHTLGQFYILAEFLGSASKKEKKVSMLAERITKTFYENEIIESLENLNFVVTNAKGFDYILPSDILEKSIAYDEFLERVGIDKWFNDDPQYQDTSFVDRGLERWVLNGTQGTREEYPEYCESLGIIEETFIFSDYKDGTIANNPVNSNEPNGLYKLDTLKKHNHDMQHDHDMSHQHNVIILGSGDETGNFDNFILPKEEVLDGGRDRTGASSISKTGETGDSDRTQMRHTLVQIYILAKFLG